MMANRIFALIANVSLEKIDQVSIDFKQFLVVFVSFARAEKQDRLSIAFELFSGLF
jgi:hypothetical protein